MNVKEMTDTKLIKTAEVVLEEIENRIIRKLSSMNESGISDDDLYFLDDMLRLTRSYGNLVGEIVKIGNEEKSP